MSGRFGSRPCDNSSYPQFIVKVFCERVIRWSVFVIIRVVPVRFSTLSIAFPDQGARIAAINGLALTARSTASAQHYVELRAPDDGSTAHGSNTLTHKYSTLNDSVVKQPGPEAEFTSPFHCGSIRRQD